MLRRRYGGEHGAPPTVEWEEGPMKDEAEKEEEKHYAMLVTAWTGRSVGCDGLHKRFAAVP